MTGKKPSEFPQTTINAIKAKLSLLYSVKDFGAIGNGITDDKAAFQAAYDYAKLNNGIVYIPFGTYRLSDFILLDSSKSIAIVGDGVERSIILCDKAAFVKSTNTPILQTTLSSSVAVRDTDITLASVVGIMHGQLIAIDTDELMEETTRDHPKTHVGKVVSVTGNVVKLDRDTALSFNSANNTVVSAYNIGNFCASGFSVKSASTLVGYKNFFDLNHTRVDISRVSIHNTLNTFRGINAEGSYLSGIALSYCIDSVISLCSLHSIHYGIISGYGSSNVVIRDIVAYNCQHINNACIGSRHFSAVDCTGYGCWGALDSHQTAIESYFTNCKDIKPVDNHPKFRGRIDKINNCYFDSNVRLETDPGLLEGFNVYKDFHFNVYLGVLDNASINYSISNNRGS